MPDFSNKDPAVDEAETNAINPEAHSRNWADIGSGGLLLVVACMVLLAARGIEKRLAIGAGSGFMPNMIAIGLIVASLSIIVSGWRTKEPHPGINSPGRKKLAVMGTTCALIGLYVASLGVFGFFLSTSLYLFTQLSLLAPKGHKHWPRLGLISVGVALFVHTTFTQMFRLNLPTGLWG